MILTRYLGSHLEDILMNCRLKVSKGSELNDLFEFRHKIVGRLKRDVATAYYVKKLEDNAFTQLIREDSRLPRMSNHDMKRHFQVNQISIVDGLLNSMPESTKQIIDEVTNKTNELMRVICFTKPTVKRLDEILLWSHYTQNHSGFRIWINLSLEESGQITARDVDYSEDLISLDVNDLFGGQDPMSILSNAIVTKAKCWGYENEVRVLMPKECCKSEKVDGEILEYMDIPLESLARIDFGVKFPKEERDRHIERLKENGLSGIEFFQCALSYDKYAINYERI